MPTDHTPLRPTFVHHYTSIAVLNYHTIRGLVLTYSAPAARFPDFHAFCLDVAISKTIHMSTSG